MTLEEKDQLEKLIDRIVENYDRIPVRERMYGEWGSYTLAELPIQLALKHMGYFIKLHFVTIFEGEGDSETPPPATL